MRLLRVRDVVQLTGLSERTVRAMLADGRLIAVRPPGLRVVWIPESEVERLAQARRPARPRAAS
jgi:excisionase family DNA binding protein